MTFNISIDNKTIIRVFAAIILFALGAFFIRASTQALTLIVISAFLAMALNPPVSYLSSKITGGSRGAATGIAYLCVVSIIGLFLWAMVPPLVSQTRQFIDDLPTYIEEFSEGDDAVSTFVRDNDIQEEVEDFVSEFTTGSSVGDSSAQIFDGIGRVGSAIVSLLTVLVLTFFMLVEGPTLMKKFWLLQDEKKQVRRKVLVGRMYGVITGYVNGQLLIALLAATASLIAMLIVGIPLPLPLAGLVGLFGLLPLVGATLGSLAVIIVALFQSVQAAIAMAAFFIIYQQIENNAIQPIIQSRALEISPLIIFIAVLFGISVGGLLGAFIAIPIAACLRILAIDYIEQRKKKIEKKPSIFTKAIKSKVEKALED